MADKPAKTKVLDFTNVKDRDFKIKHLQEGDYAAKVVKVIDYTSDAGHPQWLYTIALTGNGAGKGASFPYYCGLDSKSLWKVRNLFIACGLNVPKKRLNVDPTKVLNRSLGVSLEDDEYDGKMKSVIAATIPLSEIGGAAEDAEEDDEEVEEEVDEEEVEDVVEEDTEDDTEEEEGDTEEEEEDEEPPPPPKKSKKSKKSKTKTKAKSDEVGDDELEELEIEEL